MIGELFADVDDNGFGIFGVNFWIGDDKSGYQSQKEGNFTRNGDRV